MKTLYLISTIDENYLPFTIKKVVEDKESAIKEFLKLVKSFVRFLEDDLEVETDIDINLLDDIETFDDALKSSDYIWKLSTQNGINGQSTGLLYGVEDDEGNRIMLHEINY